MGIFNQNIESISYQCLVYPESEFIENWAKSHGNRIYDFTFDGNNLFCRDIGSTLYAQGSLNLREYLPTATKITTNGSISLFGGNKRNFDIQNIHTISTANVIELVNIKRLTDMALTAGKVRLDRISHLNNVVFKKVDYIDVLRNFTKFRNCEFDKVGCLTFKEPLIDELDFIDTIKRWLFESKNAILEFKRGNHSYWFPDAHKYSVEQILGFPCKGISTIYIRIRLFLQDTADIRFEQDTFGGTPYPGSVTSDGFAITVQVE